MPAATAVALVLGLGGVALAASGIAGTGSTTIKGCYNKTSGALTVLTSSHKTCSSSETAISWDKTGPTGPPGPATPGYFTGGQFADDLGTPQTVAQLTLPAGTFLYNVSVNFVNDLSSSDTVTCDLTDGGGNAVDSAAVTVAGSTGQTISITGASTSAAGAARVSCQDTSSSGAAYVNGAEFTATKTSSLPTEGAVLRTGGVSGSAIAKGDTLSSTFVPGECTSGSVAGTVSANPASPGTASISISSMTVNGCTVTIPDVGAVSITVTANDLPYSMTVSDVDGNTATTGPVSWTVSAASLKLTCTYGATSLTGHWSNAINGVEFVNQSLTGASSNGSLCPGTFGLSGQISNVMDTSASGSPSVFVS